MKKISCVCTTYRRFSCVERIISQYYQQTYQNKELIIFNTDINYPLYLSFSDDSIKIINNSKNYTNYTDYTSRGQILRDAVTHATGDLFSLWDDDDIYLPWHLQQGVDEIVLDAWKPEYSFFRTKEKIELVNNTMEASVIVNMNRIKEIGFREDLTGYEGLSWYTKLRDEKQLNEQNKNYLPSYCFNWSDDWEIAGHKQSGDINNTNNFENHKLNSFDFAKRGLENNDISGLYEPYYTYLREHKQELNQNFYKKYFINE